MINTFVRGKNSKEALDLGWTMERKVEKIRKIHHDFDTIGKIFKFRNLDHSRSDKAQCFLDIISFDQIEQGELETSGWDFCLKSLEPNQFQWRWNKDKNRREYHYRYIVIPEMERALEYVIKGWNGKWGV
jgi:hypothetical protein